MKSPHATAVLPEQPRRLSEEKRALLDRRLRGGAGGSGDRIPPRRDAESAPQSFAQRQMWVIDRLTPGNPAYNLPVAYRVRGALDVARLERAVNAVIARHEVLRTTFYDDGTGPRQRIHPSLTIAVEVSSVEDVPGAEREHRVRELMRGAAMHEFDLTRLPLVRVHAYRLAAGDHVVLINVHHIATDGTSGSLLMAELDAHYRMTGEGGAPVISPLAIQYGDFAEWQCETVANGRALAAAVEFWRAKLREPLPALELPADRPRPSVQAFHGSNVFCEIPAALSRRLAAFAAAHDCTMFMTILAAFQVLMRRYTGSEDIIVGTPVATRPADEVAPLIGNFLNIAALRCDVSGDPTFAELLRRTRDTTLDALSNADAPYFAVLEQLKFSRQAGRNPIFQVMLQVMTSPAPHLGGLDVAPFHFDLGTAQFDLSLHLYEEGDGYTGRFEYCTDLFDAPLMERMAENFIHLLGGIAGHADTRVAQLPLIEQAEMENLVTSWNGPRSDPRVQFVHQLFEAQASQTPARTAIVCERAGVTYAELDARANAIAERLRARGIGVGDRVGLCIERGSGMVAAVLGILKAGAAYVPLDPAYPRARLQFLASDAQLAALVCTTDLAELIDVPAERRLLLDKNEPPAGGIMERAPRPPAADAPAYVLYTSGSTGSPKGVVVTHANVCNLIASIVREPGIDAHDTFVAQTTLSFDIAVVELLAPLTVGATVAVATRDEATDGRQLRALAERAGATMMQGTPATWRMLLDAGWLPPPGLKAIVGGEPLPREVARALVNHGAVLWNMYGPTETTVYSTGGLISDAEDRITIGRPIANTSVLVLDAHGELAPVGVPGEACIGGAGVAAGYLGRPSLTDERFVANPVPGARDARLYRTGDLARWLPDGRLEHLGRIDRQLKIRGFRIEPSEVEAALRRHSAVADAVVDARRASDGDPRLVAYVVFAQQADATVSELRRHVRGLLPEYMVPGLVVPVTAIPMTPNGKTDRAALPDPFTTVRDAARFEPPQTPAESAVADVWRDLLHVDRVGREDNFIELGGHSLLALRAAIAVQERTGQRIDARRFFFQTLSQIAGSIPDSRYAPA